MLVFCTYRADPNFHFYPLIVTPLEERLPTSNSFSASDFTRWFLLLSF